MDQPRLGLLHGIRFDAERQVLGLGQAVVALRKLRPQHPAVFLADIVEAVVFQRDTDILFKVRRVRAEIHERQLKMNGAVKEVQEPAPFIENGRLILLLRKLIIDVLKLDRLGVVVIAGAADAVLEHPLERDRLLRRARNAVIFLCVRDDPLYLLSLLFAERLWQFQPDVFLWLFSRNGKQFSLPPFLPDTGVSEPCNSCRCSTAFPSASGILLR